MCITVGGDKQDYYDDARSPEANFLETKNLINSVISDAKKDSRFMSACIKDHFLETLMRDPKCMIVKHKHLPDDIRTTCNLEQMKTADDCIHIKIQ